MKKKTRTIYQILADCWFGSYLNAKNSGCSKIATTLTLSSMAITPNPAPVLTVSYSQSFNAIATYSNGSTAEISTQAMWKCSEVNVATVNKNGNATGLAVGVTNITATLDGITSPPVIVSVITLSSIFVTPNPPSNLAVGSHRAVYRRWL